MIGFVLSGGGNRGALQAGGLVALFEQSIAPALIVGTSAGAYNGTFIATQPTLEGANRLADLWRATRAQELFHDNLFIRAWRFITGADSLTSTDGLRRFIERAKPPGVNTFGDLKCKLYLVTADLASGNLYLYGDDPTADLTQALLASSAVPGLFPPVDIQGQQYVDGAVVANVPISVALDHGATTLYVLDLFNSGPRQRAHGILNILERAAQVAVYQQLVYDLRRAIQDPSVVVHHIYFGDLFDGVGLEDFSLVPEMVRAGYARTQQYLSHPIPLDLRSFAAAGLKAPPGARRYIPRP